MLLAPKTLAKSLDNIEQSIESVARVSKPEDRAALTEKARKDLDRARTELQQAADQAAIASPARVPYWVGGAQQRIAALKAGLTSAVEAAQR